MRKRWIKWIIIIIFISVGIFYALNIKVSTRQGINYQWQTIEIPLYLKILDFFDRHYNYKWTVERIIGDSNPPTPPFVKGGDEGVEKVLKIFEWTHENIKKTPESYPVIDDHVWHIIVRGYGVGDQLSDVFTTLCNYAGIDAFFDSPYAEDRNSRITLSFVKIDGKWNVFDPYNGVYFKNREGSLASIEEIIKGNWLTEGINKDKGLDINYAIYFKNLSPIKEMELQRSNVQSPINRFKYQIKKWLN
ncbi:MAG: transglutaminase domain-containing protein [Nitrospinae bacterium]|nr:transglutaminase domain-containing protein [Nitrospinota bacterium]